MSADNWTTCPKCAFNRNQEIARLTAAADAMYGSVPIAEFDEARERAAKLAALDLDRTFREDYEFYGANEGVLHISYSGHCSKCGLSHKVSREEPFWPGDES